MKIYTCSVPSYNGKVRMSLHPELDDVDPSLARQFRFPVVYGYGHLHDDFDWVWRESCLSSTHKADDYRLTFYTDQEAIDWLIEQEKKL
jgi:hypothetical protein